MHDSRRGVLVVSLVLLCAAPWTATRASEARLDWNACAADGGVRSVNPTCDTNAGFHQLVLAVDMTEDVAGITGIEAVLRISTGDQFRSGVDLPDWWRFTAINMGVGCRGAALSANGVIAESAQSCEDWSLGTALVSPPIYSYPQFLGPGMARVILGASASTGPQQMLAGHEYFLMNMRIFNSHTMGDGACAGCEIPVHVFVDGINIVRGIENSMFLGGGLQAFASWLPQPTPTRSRSWAQLKALYH